MRPRPRQRARGLGIAVGAILPLAFSGCGGSSSPPVSVTGPAVPGRLPPARTTPLRSIFQADVALHEDPARTLDTMRALGADTVRLILPWGQLGPFVSIAPDPASPTPPPAFRAADPAAYPAAGWASYDTILRDAHDRGMAVDLTLGPPPPLWARGPGDPGHPVHTQWRLNVAAFGQWVRAVATRYSGHYRDAAGRLLPRVSLWSVWNEPNFGPDIAPQTTAAGVDVSPVIYRGMVDAAWTALRATGHGTDTILIGELAPYGESFGNPGSFGYMVPLRFLRSLYCVGPGLRRLTGSAATQLGCPPAGDPSRFRAAHPGLFAASGLSLHPYPQGPPSVVIPGEPDYANLASLPKVESTIDAIFRTYGSSRQIPLWSTEFGVHTDPPETAYSISPAQAADYLNQSEYLTWRDPRLRSYDQYLLEDAPSGEFATGLEFAGGRPKPGYAAYRMPLYLPVDRRSGRTPLELWGAVRPARYASGVQRVALQFRPSGAGAFRTIRVVSLPAGSVYFDVLQRFVDAGSVRTAWRSPNGRLLLSRTAQIS